MAEYKCKSVPLMKLVPTAKGFLSPLCDKCKSRDCENPIEKMTVALPVVGNKVMKVLVQGRNVGLVYQCEGYITR
jgi:hypothetical protein